MKEEITSVQAKGLNKEKVLKASFVLKCKGSNLTEEIRKTVERLSEEYDKKIVSNQDLNEYLLIYYMENA